MSTPQGEITIQTLAMPKDTNANGDIFGGWLVSQMDLSAGMIAKKRARGRVATVAIESMSFLKPVHVGDIVTCHAMLKKVGRTSMTIAVEAWAEPATGGERFMVTSGVFIFVAIDDAGNPREVPVSA
ncbi:acyl-CoA thioester hydrolase [Legionella geestiana]|uniref:Acyl-CoA thioester hydrolase n=1 Tax=Legionella geestiana TaxID=45065 RepID=A0A0W0U5J6_9GAMM|nr:acyl-CoA thioesterase [Legionella geestiana]KTD03208.1 acyl-CoA thioester hydrolase [Legionella geestiana]QBS12221.1 acyl-CoA thioesterase [Legionella geestiana]QDQ40067.1 acyl-CoA thioesterase [Legionella geestiana]STX53046.1 acyl-CoA thioesterase YciA [Legionella geestiana]